MAKWPDTPVYTPIANINKGNEYQEADGLTAADMNAIVENIDYLYNNSSSDVDTLKNIIKGGIGIVVVKNTSAQILTIRIDPSSAGWMCTTSGEKVGVAQSGDAAHIAFYLGSEPTIEYKSNNFTSYFKPPIKPGGTYTFTTTSDFKTINGKSIVGIGDITISGGSIDLYQHHILCSTPNEGIKVLITVISSKNLKVNSLTDLKTLLGNTFEYPCTGYAMARGQSLAICNENGFLPIDIWVNVRDPTPDVTWSNIESIVDTVTTI